MWWQCDTVAAMAFQYLLCAILPHNVVNRSRVVWCTCVNAIALQNRLPTCYICVHRLFVFVCCRTLRHNNKHFETLINSGAHFMVTMCIYDIITNSLEKGRWVDWHSDVCVDAYTNTHTHTHTHTHIQSTLYCCAVVLTHTVCSTFQFSSFTACILTWMPTFLCLVHSSITLRQSPYGAC